MFDPAGVVFTGVVVLVCITAILLVVAFAVELESAVGAQKVLVTFRSVRRVGVFRGLGRRAGAREGRQGNCRGNCGGVVPG